jgi:hypothetical protein
MDCDNVFRRAWHLSQYCERRLSTVVIEYRWAMALLASAYAEKVDEIRKASGPSKNRGGQGKVTGQATDALLQLIDPNFTAADRRVFRKRLDRAKRWLTATEVLGWGSLCLMPVDLVSKRFAEKVSTVDQWSTWLELVKRVNPDAYRASLALDKWVGIDGIKGGPIQSTDLLCIEATGPTAINQVEEIADSDDDAPDGTSASPNASPRPLHQLTLLELFAPQ